MPGEFEPQKQVWMLWPIRTDVWRDGAKPAQEAYARVAEAICQFEPVTMGVSKEQYTNARAMLPKGVRVVEMSSNDAWMRDMAPAFVINGSGTVRGVDWGFNAWGGLTDGLYFPWDQDAMIAEKSVVWRECVGMMPQILSVKTGQSIQTAKERFSQQRCVCSARGGILSYPNAR